ncbi:SCO family protein [Ramlibacter sp.]|uniref:SCO family protein n=1 Tax=Ramlibacter sp. TaxID=1917967 RepID=UPI002C62A83B|nr:SCO family protein [Ramlibacter sp.]HWI81457.1 SCO family protein [Ramlibacter sp.]
MDRRSFLRTVPAIAAGALIASCTQDKPQFKAVDLTGADYARDFQLVDFDGRPRSLKDFRGRAVVLFFGYTQCPDVCPTTLSEVAEAKRLLGPDGAKVQAVFITLDPERDTPEVLKAYMANFDPAFLALRPAPAQLPELAKEFKIYYKKVDGKTPTSYTMDHSAASYVYDPRGRLRLYTRYGTGPEALASDLKLLLGDA